jgi:tripartite-type tricarboxylate transporter receptor subunit TctC
MKTPKLVLGAVASALLLVLGARADDAQAQAVDVSKYPARPVRLIIPFPPGGSNDILGRFIAQKLTERLGQQTIADNRPGADGIIGTDVVARSAPDGLTLLIISTSYTMNPAIHKLPYDPIKSLAPVSMIASGPNVIAVNPSLPVSNIKGLIALAKSRPNQVRYASSGVGGFNHFGGELFNSMAGVKMVHIPYKGGAPAMLDVVTGQVEVSFGTLIQTLPHLRSGRLKPLGVGTLKRSPVVPDVPTISEAGVPGYDGTIWWGILSPAGVPEGIIAKLNTTLSEILREPEMAKRLSAEAAEPIIESPAAFGKLIANDIQKWAKIAKQAGIQAQ